MINLITAFDPNFVIGKDNSLPWKIKEDLKLFRSLTENNIVIMGRNTYESIGKPLINRINIVITSTNIIGNFYTFSIIEEALKYCEKINPNKEVYIIGGRRLYQSSLEKNLIQKMYISKIKKIYEGNIKFPEFLESNWDKELKSSYEEFDLWIYKKK